jgi:hypothetical protein
LRIPKYPLSLEEAKQAPDGYVILEGEYGGICYLLCPANLVVCDERTLRLLADDLEEAIFPSDSQGAGVRFERLALEEGLGGFAMGEESGIALSTLWIPKWLSEAQLSIRIQQILAGKLSSLDLSSSEKAMVKVLHHDYQAQKFEEETK